MPPGYEIQENGRVTGPHSLVVLLQKAEIHALRPDTLVRLAASPSAPATPAVSADSAVREPEPWLPIRDLPELHAHLFPARATHKLASPATPSATAAVTYATPNAAYDAEHAGTDVFQILRDNSARERAAEGELLRDLGPRPNNRRRDYLVLAIGLNLFCLVAGLLTSFLSPALIGLWVMGNIGLVWIVFFVMGRY